MTPLQKAYEDYATLPMPKLDEKHLHDRPKYQLEDEAIRGQISMIAKKHGVAFKELDDYIEMKSNEMFKGKH